MGKKIISNEVNQDILNLYKLYKGTVFNDRVPILYNEFEPDNNYILFIGLNPSFSDNLKGITNFTEKEYNDFFSKSDLNEDDVNKIIEMHEKTIQEYPYFQKFLEITKIAKLKFAHVDLFHCRITSQKSLAKNLSNQPLYKKESVAILQKIIDQINPKIIVVENTLTRNILIDEFNLFPKLEDIDLSIGTPLYSGKPVFYTSMLTGQRALDLGSYQRLIWHIQHALKLI